jgi:hypothetical protein
MHRPPGQFIDWIQTWIQHWRLIFANSKITPSIHPSPGWAARLRDVSEEEALAELANLGYSNGRRAEKFQFANGTGSSKKRGSKRGTSSRSNARRSSRK